MGKNALLSDRSELVSSILALTAIILDYGYQLNYTMHFATDVVYILLSGYWVYLHAVRVSRYPSKDHIRRTLWIEVFLSSVLFILAWIVSSPKNCSVEIRKYLR